MSLSARRVGSAPQRWRGTTPLDVTLDWLGAVAASDGTRYWAARTHAHSAAAALHLRLR